MPQPKSTTLDGFTSSKASGTIRRPIVANLAQGVSARNWEVRTIFPAWADDEFIAWCRDQGLEPELSRTLTALSSAGLGGALGGQLRLRSFFRDAQANVVNFHYSGS